ncbi:MAG: hypothetical protein ACLPQS_09800 [Acidimicrobiales bacterium]
MTTTTGRGVLLRTAALAALTGLLSCALASCANSPRVGGPHRTSPPAGRTSSPSSTTAGVASSPTTLAPISSRTGSSGTAAEAAWVQSERAFYEAGRLGEPEYPPLLASFAHGSPALGRTVAWLIALRDAGVIAPATYRVGNARVTRVTAKTAWLSGCTYDTGSVYRSTGAEAPVNLGGGASFTASVAVLRLVGGRWLVWSDQTSTPSSPEENGPCHGY